MNLPSPHRPRSLALALLLGGAALGLGAQSVGPIGILVGEQSRTAFTVQGAGARAMGLGGAFIAVADDATAASFNPAGLAQLLRPEATVVGRAAKRSVAYEDVSTLAGTHQLAVTDSLISSTRFDPLFLSATLPFRAGDRNLAVQLSVQRLIALGDDDSRDMTEYPLDLSAPSHLHQAIRQDGQIDLYSLAVAYELTQRILLGITVNLWRGAWSLDSRSSKATGVASSYVNYSQQNDLEGSNYNLGLIWRWPTWSLGLVHRTAFHADYTFSSRLETSSQTDGPRTSAPFTAGLHWPATTGLGWAWRPREAWLLTADLTRTPWSKARYMTSRENLNGLNFFDLDKGNRTADSTNVHVGLERILVTAAGTVIPLRLGYSREPQPVVDRITSQQRVLQACSLGSGIKRGAYTFDASYRYGWGSRRSSQFLDVDQILGQTKPTSLGRETVREHRVDLSLAIQFDRQPIEALLHHLFVGDR